MNKYELVLIVDAQRNAGEKENIIKEVAETVGKAGAKVINSQVWIEKHKFSFKIKRCAEGTYYLMIFESKADGVVKVRQDLKLNEGVLRFAIMKA